MSANKCPKCGLFIFGTYCCNCKEDITEMKKDYDWPDFFNNFFGGNENAK